MPPFEAEVGRLARLTVEGGHRGDVDDGSPRVVLEGFGLGHGPGRDADHVEGADEVDRDDLLEHTEVVWIAFPVDGALRPADTGAVGHQTKRPVGGRGFDGRLHRLGVGDIGVHVRGPEVGGHGLALLVLEIGDGDRRAERGQVAGGRLAESGGAAGDEC